MRVVYGDLIKMAERGEFDVIVHGCNCFCTFGAGIARQIKKSFPEAAVADSLTERGDREKLGRCGFVECYTKDGSSITVVNAYTQFDYRGSGIKCDYDALRQCFKIIHTKLLITNMKDEYCIGYPKIGAGLAGGDWDIIAKIIDEELKGDDHTLVEYQPED